jgi:FHA domain-containing protein
MTTTDDDGPGNSTTVQTAVQRDAPVLRLEQALAEETRTSAALRDSLEALRQKVDLMAVGFEQRLIEARQRSEANAARFADQQARLEALGSGREETMHALAEARAELARVKVERDQLRQQLTRIDGMQTATLTLPDEDDEIAPNINLPPPSLDELMAGLGAFEEAGQGGHRELGHLHKRVELDPDESQEMIAPELVFPEEYGAPKAGTAGTPSTPRTATSRVLVFLDSEQPIKYPIYKDLMTIGRSDSADIQVSSDFVSRVHARIVSTPTTVTVEDVSSKNGIQVNEQDIDRCTLRHGDVLGLGRLRFAFIDMSVAELD